MSHLLWNVVDLKQFMQEFFANIWDWYSASPYMYLWDSQKNCNRIRDILKKNLKFFRASLSADSKLPVSVKDHLRETIAVCATDKDRFRDMGIVCWMIEKRYLCGQFIFLSVSNFSTMPPCILPTVITMTPIHSLHLPLLTEGHLGINALASQIKKCTVEWR